MAARSPSLPKQLADRNAHREAGEALQGLAGRVTLTPGEKRGEMRATLHGDLATIVEWTEHGGPKEQNRQFLPMAPSKSLLYHGA